MAGLRPVTSAGRSTRNAHRADVEIAASARAAHMRTTSIRTTSRSFRRRLDLLDGDLRQTEVADLALVLELSHEPELLLARDLGVDAVQLPQVDGLDAEPAHAHEAALAQVLRASEFRPEAWAVARKAALRRDVDAVKRMQRLVDQFLGVLRAVCVGGVDEIDAELRQPLEDGDRGVVVFRWAPYALARDAHGAVAQTSYFQVTADLEAAGGG